jgi:hypothetical protein
VSAEPAHSCTAQEDTLRPVVLTLASPVLYARLHATDFTSNVPQRVITTLALQHSGPHSAAFLETLIGPQYRNSPQFVETEGSLPCQEETATGLSPERN